MREREVKVSKIMKWTNDHSRQTEILPTLPINAS